MDLERKKVRQSTKHIKNKKKGDSNANIDELNKDNRIIFKYEFENPIGSVDNIAGIINKKGNVLGMMPHPERACDNILGSNDGEFIFESILGNT